MPRAPRNTGGERVLRFFPLQTRGAARLLREIGAKRRGQEGLESCVGFLGFLFVCGVFGSSLPAFGINVCGFVQGRTVGKRSSRKDCLQSTSATGNRTKNRDLIDKYIDFVPIPVLEVLPLIEDIRVSRVKGKTLFEMAENDPSLNYVCEYYLNIADQLIANPEGVVPNESSDRELFSLLSDFYLNPTLSKNIETEFSNPILH